MFEFPWLLQQAFCLTDCICAAETLMSLLCLGSAGLCQIIEMLSQLARLKSSCVPNGSTCLNSFGLADLSLGEIIGMLFESAKSFLEASFTFNTGQLKSIFVSEIFTCLNSLGFAGLSHCESIVMLFELTESLVEAPFHITQVSLHATLERKCAAHCHRSADALNENSYKENDSG